MSRQQVGAREHAATSIFRKTHLVCFFLQSMSLFQDASLRVRSDCLPQDLISRYRPTSGNLEAGKLAVHGETPKVANA